MARRLPRGQETRERIMATALRLFAERGFSAVSIEEIAQAAGVTKGAVYHWFTDKDDLGRELQHELYERLSAASMRVLDPQADVVANMVRAFDTYLSLLGDLGEARFFLRDAWVIPALDEGGRRDHESAVALVRDVLADAVVRGELVDLDPDPLAHVLLGAFAEATLHVLRTGDREGVEQVVRHLLGSLRSPSRANPSSRRRAAVAGSKGATS